MSGWIGVDLDGTLAIYGATGIESVGAPIPAMVARVQAWLDRGIEVRIVTARVGVCGEANVDGIRDDQAFADAQRTMIEDWCLTYLGQKLKVTSQKDFMMLELWDDRAVRVHTNTGERCCPGAEL